MSLREAGAVGATATWVLSNHDVVRHLSRYALPQSADLKSWLLSNGTDPAPDLALGLRRARAAALLMLALPGSSYLYQGEELGLPEVADLAPQYLQDPTWERSEHHDKGRDGCRVPLPWEPTGPSFGFSSVNGWLPQPADWAGLSWAAQDGDPASTLELYRSALALRRKFGTDDALTWLTRGPATLSFARSNGLVCIVNFGVEPVAIPAGQLLLASGELVDGGLLGTDTAAWVLTN